MPHDRPSREPARPDPPRAAPIPYARQLIDESDAAAVLEALRSDFVTQGPRVAWFEDGLKEATGARYAVAVSSGTAALQVACQALGVSAADAGVVPANTFAATANCLRWQGAGVRFCDVDPATGLAEAGHFEAALGADGGTGGKGEGGQRTTVLLPVSYAGRCPNLPAIAALAGRRGCRVIEDAAHSLGATYADASGRTFASASCAHSDAAILSFHPVKAICAGEGGAVLTNDPTLVRRARALRSHGIERPPPVAAAPGADPWRYDQTALGWNFRLTDIQAALGASQLAKLPAFIERRRTLARRYLEAFAEEPFRGRLEPPGWDDGSAWHLFVVLFADEGQRRRAYDWLLERGVRCQVHYIPVHWLSCHAAFGQPSLPGAEGRYRRCLSLPLFPGLVDEDQDRVVAALRAFFARKMRPAE